MYNFGQLGRYIKDNKGSFSTSFALIIVPLLLGVGLAVDSKRGYNYQKELQGAADIAAVTAAQAYVTDGEDGMKKSGADSFMDNAALIHGSKVNIPIVERVDSNVIIRASGSFVPMFPRLFGYPQLDYSVISKASIVQTEGLEIVIAFDSTNSLNFGNRWQTALNVMQTALNDMQSLSSQNNFYISLLPFSDRVNIGKSNAHMVQKPIPPTWEGCVEPREENSGGSKRALDDDRAALEPFTASIPGTRFPFAQQHTVMCSKVELIGPTASISQIIAGMNQLSPSGTGRFGQAMAWAWRLLSPKWHGDWGVSGYPSQNLSGKPSQQRAKKIVFLTDGNSEISFAEMDNERSWGYNQGSVNQFNDFVNVCNDVKKSGIEIYMVNIDGNPHAVPFLRQCASSLDHYYFVTDEADISLALVNIRNELVENIRLLN